MKYLVWFHKKMMTWEENITCLFLFQVVFLVFFAALLRLLGVPQAWMGDLSKLLFAWVIFLGSDTALNAGRHIGVEFFEELLPESWRKWIAQFWSILIIGFLAFLTYYGWYLTQKSRREFDSLMLSDLTLAVGFSGFVIGCVVFDYLKSNRRNLRVYIALIVAIIAATVFWIVNLDLDHTAKPISYSYLIVSVPVGCLLMIRTTCLGLVKNWSYKNA